MSSIFGIFKSNQKPKKELKQQDINLQTKTALLQSCNICNNYGAEKITFGDNLQPKLTCKRCELKAVNNDSSKLATHLIAIEKFSEALAKQVRNYYLEKSNPNNLVKTNAGQLGEIQKTSETQITQLKAAYKQLQVNTQKKLQQLVTISTSCNKVTIFDNVNKLVSDKKLQEVGNGNLFLKHTVVDNSVHFFSKDQMQQDNKKIAKRLLKCEQVCKVQLLELDQLVTDINKLVL